QQLVNLGLAPVRDLAGEGAGEMQRPRLRPIGEMQAVMAPAARGFEGDLVAVPALERPVVGRGELLDQIQWISADSIRIKLRSGHSPGLLRPKDGPLRQTPAIVSGRPGDTSASLFQG